MSIPADQLVQHAVTIGVLSEQEAEDLLKSGPRYRDGLSTGKQLADTLVDQGRLTSYQAELLCQGNVDALTFGDYVILDEIGSGGMGRVLKAMHRRMKRVVALKAILDKESQSRTAIQRFQREVEASARLVHPNIVTSFDAGEIAGRHYLVMDFVDGFDLEKLLQSTGPFAVGQAIDYIIQAARGCEYAHGMGVIHRDIKPANLLLDKKGQVKILDMGLARMDPAAAGSAETEEQLTKSGMILGTMDYLSPEQAVNTKDADERSDIYSLGCTFYRFLTGEPPYPGRTSVEKILAHRDQPIPSVRAFREDVPEELDRVLQQMLAKKPKDRPQAMSDIIQNLEPFAGWKFPDKFGRTLIYSPRTLSSEIGVATYRQLIATDAKNADRLYRTYCDTYRERGLTPWDREDYEWRALKWVYYGRLPGRVPDEEIGVISVRNTQGLIKITGMQGPNALAKITALRQIADLMRNDPIYGMVDAELAEKVVRLGFKTPPASFVTLVSSKIVSDERFAAGGTWEGVNPDGGMRFNLEGIGITTKYIIGNQTFFEMITREVLESMGIGHEALNWMVDLLGD